jgi:hypothetical protein
VKVPTTNEGWIELEDGVEVKFEKGEYKTGDYWLIPARAATGDSLSGDIEWPLDAQGKPEAQPPHGIRHYYCCLAIVDFNSSLVQDCRRLFSPLTELTSFFYVGGDGQEAMPGERLKEALQVGVANGQWPVEDAPVKFTVKKGGGTLKAGNQSGTEIIVKTGKTGDNKGIAECYWQLGNDTNQPSQQVEARLLDADGKPTPPFADSFYR